MSLFITTYRYAETLNESTIVDGNSRFLFTIYDIIYKQYFYQLIAVDSVAWLIANTQVKIKRKKIIKK